MLRVLDIQTLLVPFCSIETYGAPGLSSTATAKGQLRSGCYAAQRANFWPQKRNKLLYDVLYVIVERGRQVAVSSAEVFAFVEEGQ